MLKSQDLTMHTNLELILRSNALVCPTCDFKNVLTDPFLRLSPKCFLSAVKGFILTSFNSVGYLKIS